MNSGNLKRNPAPNEIGKQYGLLTVIDSGGKDKQGNALWICRCYCGNLTKVRATNLRTQTRSCGCVRKSSNRYKEIVSTLPNVIE